MILDNGGSRRTDIIIIDMSPSTMKVVKIKETNNVFDLNSEPYLSPCFSVRNNLFVLKGKKMKNNWLCHRDLQNPVLHLEILGVLLTTFCERICFQRFLDAIIFTFKIDWRLTFL